ncbi:MAG: PilZ domain-containing protein [Bacteroidetes bacterium]|nr:PilZ domain-containing protein [Bacteroidota bacterium]
MNIRTINISRCEIDTIMMMRGLIGHVSIELNGYLHNCIYKSRYIQLIDMNNFTEIDKTGIVALTDFVYHRGNLGLLNVANETMEAIKKVDKNCSIKFYNNMVIEEALFLLKNSFSGGNVENINRRYLRIDTFFNTEFKCNISSKIIPAFAKVINLSESGMLINNINVFNIVDRNLIDHQQIYCKELYDIKLKTDNEIENQNIEGICVRKVNDDDFSAGIKFKNIGENIMDSIKNYKNQWVKI